MTDKKTTIAAIMQAIGVIVTGASFALDNDPATVIDMQAIVAAAGVVIAAIATFAQGWFSKDK